MLSGPIHMCSQTPQSAEPIFRVDVHVVQVDAQVLSKKTRRAAPALKQDDFQIYEDNVPQKITEFSRDTLPLSVVIILTSLIVRGRSWRRWRTVRWKLSSN